MVNFDTKNPLIKLNQTETKITNLLKDYVNLKNSKISDESKKLELRITGGWVRDKLLGNESNDLDIAINTQSGEEFADGLKAFLSENFEKYGIKPSNIHKIEKNPEKSKHLETATTKLYGLDIDFVNLRSEEYTEESRIPIIKFGTPEEDALRRDATLNALFYNIQKDKVEDLTGSGLQDLHNGVLRTPLPPLQTFLDDPLRVLRLIRFASRFNFTISDETLQAMKEEGIKEALLYKISRERVGVELEKTLKGPNPDYGLRLLSMTRLYEAVFNFGVLQDTVLSLNDPANLSKIFDTVETWTYPSVEKVKSTNFSNSSIEPIILRTFEDPNLKELFWIALVLRPWSNILVSSNLKKLQQKLQASELIIKDGLKFSKNHAQIVTLLLSKKDQYQKIISALPSYKRSEAGLLLKLYGENYELSLVFNLFDEIISQGSYENVIKKYEIFNDIVIKEDLQNVYKLKPIIDGKKLSQALEKKPGPWMALIMERILVWQLDNPECNVEDCIEFVKTIINEY